MEPKLGKATIKVRTVDGQVVEVPIDTSQTTVGDSTLRVAQPREPARELDDEDRQQAYEDALNRLAQRHQGPPPEEEVREMQRVWNPPRPDQVGPGPRRPQPHGYEVNPRTGSVREIPRPSQATPAPRAPAPQVRQMAPESPQERYQNEQRRFMEQYGYQPSPDEWVPSQRTFSPPAPARTPGQPVMRNGQRFERRAEPGPDGVNRVRDTPWPGKRMRVNGQEMEVIETPDGLQVNPVSSPDYVPNSPLKPEFQGSREQMVPTETVETPLPAPSGTQQETVVVDNAARRANAARMEARAQGLPEPDYVAETYPHLWAYDNLHGGPLADTPGGGVQAIPRPGEVGYEPPASAQAAPQETRMGMAEPSYESAGLPPYGTAAPQEAAQPRQPSPADYYARQFGDYRDAIYGEEAYKYAQRQAYADATQAAHSQVLQDQADYAQRQQAILGQMEQVANETRQLVRMQPNPQQWWNNQSGFNRAVMLMGAAMHNVLSVRMGQVPGQNPVLDTIAREIDQDIALQQANRETRLNELKAAEGMLGDQADQELRLYTSKMARYESLIKQAERMRDNALDGSTGRQTAIMMIEDLEARKAAEAQKLAMARMKMAGGGRGRAVKKEDALKAFKARGDGMIQRVNPDGTAQDRAFMTSGNDTIQNETLRAVSGYERLRGATQRFQETLMRCGDAGWKRYASAFIPGQKLTQVAGDECYNAIVRDAEAVVGPYRETMFGKNQTERETWNLGNLFGTENVALLSSRDAMKRIERLRSLARENVNGGLRATRSLKVDDSGMPVEGTAATAEDLFGQMRSAEDVQSAYIDGKKAAGDWTPVKDYAQRVAHQEILTRNGLWRNPQAAQEQFEDQVRAMDETVDYFKSLPEDQLRAEYKALTRGAPYETYLSKTDDILNGMNQARQTTKWLDDSYRQYLQRVTRFRQQLKELHKKYGN